MVIQHSVIHPSHKNLKHWLINVAEIIIFTQELLAEGIPYSALNHKNLNHQHFVINVRTKMISNVKLDVPAKFQMN